MKRYPVIIFFVLIVSCSYSQNAFEGVVKFTTEIKGGNTLTEGMMPDSFIFLFKNKDVRMMLSGGIISAMMGDVISKADSNVSYMLDYSSKIAYRYDPYKYEKSTNPDIEETEKTQKILDRKCSLYKISYSTKNGYVTTDLWVSTELPINIIGNNPLGKNFSFPGVEGFPLLMESKITYHLIEFNIVIKAVKIIERPIPAHEFLIPDGFQVVPLSSPSDIEF